MISSSRVFLFPDKNFPVLSKIEVTERGTERPSKIELLAKAAL